MRNPYTHLKEILPKIHLLQCKSSTALGNMVCRFQEYYDNPRFRHQVFSVQEFKEWYNKTTKRKKFMYAFDYVGYNFPSYVLSPFREGKFNPLTKLEKHFLQKVKNIGPHEYIIGAPTGAEGVIDHEVSHGLYYTSYSYRNKVNNLVSSVNMNQAIQWLSVDMGYHESTVVDELQAYLIDKEWDLEIMQIDTPECKGVERELQRTFKRYKRKYYKG